MALAAGEAEQETAGQAISRPYLAYLMGLLLLINIVNFLDRQIPSILAQSIKRDLHLSDAQLGVMGGLAVALVYPFMGLPLAHLADRYGRRWVLGGCLLVWSALTASGGFATNFTQLVLSRLGVSAGEAGSTPAGHALIASYWPLARRSVPLAVFGLGVPLGTMLALMAGGWINDVASWRQAFLWLGVPGVLLAILTLLTVRETPRRARPAEAPAWSSALALLRKPTFLHMAIGIGAYSISANAMIFFTPAFLMRSHGLSATKTGLWLGLIYGLAGVMGTVGGGWVGDRFGRSDGRWRLWAPGLALLLAAPFTLAAWLVPSTSACLWLLAVPKFSNFVYIAPVFVALQTLVPANARASASALLLFFNSLMGLALGPPIIGLLSDWLHGAYGQQSLRYALCFVPIAQIWAAIHFTLATRTLGADLDPSLGAADL